MKYPSLTTKQNDFFNFLVKYVREYDQWPSHQDLMDEFGFKSPRSITQLYEALIKKNYLVKTDLGESIFIRFKNLIWQKATRWGIRHPNCRTYYGWGDAGSRGGRSRSGNVKIEPAQL